MKVRLAGGHLGESLRLASELRILSSERSQSGVRWEQDWEQQGFARREVGGDGRGVESRPRPAGRLGVR